MTACGCPDACHSHGRNRRTNPEYVVHFSKKNGKNEVIRRDLANRFKLGYSEVFKDRAQATRQAQYGNGERKLGENPFAGIGIVQGIGESLGESKIGDAIEHHKNPELMKGVHPAVGLAVGIGLFVLAARAMASSGATNG